MKNLFTSIVLTIMSVAAYGQITWGDLETTKGQASELIPFNGSEFYTVRFTGGRLLGKFELSYHKDLTMIASEPVNITLPTGKGFIESVSRLGDKIIVFISDMKDGVNTLYYQYYSSDCLPTNEPTEILTYSYPDKRRSEKGSYNIRTSSNGEFICLEYLLPGKKDDVDRYGFKIVNKSLEVLKTGEYESDYKAQAFQVVNRYISDSGDYFLFALLYETNEKGKVDMREAATGLLIKLDDNEQDVMEITLSESRKLSDLDFFQDEKGYMRFVGVDGGGAGIIYLLVDFKRKEILQENYNEFSRELIVQGMTDRQKKKADKKEEKGKGAPQLNRFQFSQGIVGSDGSMIGIMEQYYVVVVRNTDAQGRTISYTYNYYYNDLIVYRINPDGTFDYTTKILKRQHSTNDEGYLSSYASYIKDGQLHIFFNDNARNYDEVGKYSAPDNEVQTAGYKKKTNAVSEVVFDTESGEYTRNIAFSRTETDAIAIPKLFKVDYEHNEMLIILRAMKKEKFGLIKF